MSYDVSGHVTMGICQLTCSILTMLKGEIRCLKSQKLNVDTVILKEMQTDEMEKRKKHKVGKRKRKWGNFSSKHKLGRKKKIQAKQVFKELNIFILLWFQQVKKMIQWKWKTKTKKQNNNSYPVFVTSNIPIFSRRECVSAVSLMKEATEREGLAWKKSNVL